MADQEILRHVKLCRLIGQQAVTLWRSWRSVDKASAWPIILGLKGAYLPSGYGDGDGARGGSISYQGTPSISSRSHK